MIRCGLLGNLNFRNQITPFSFPLYFSVFRIQIKSGKNCLPHNKYYCKMHLFFKGALPSPNFQVRRWERADHREQRGGPACASLRSLLWRMERDMQARPPLFSGVGTFSSPNQEIAPLTGCRGLEIHSWLFPKTVPQLFLGYV